MWFWLVRFEIGVQMFGAETNPLIKFRFLELNCQFCDETLFQGSVIYDITMTSRNQHQDEIKL